MTVRFATNKMKLAQCLGISRTLLYQFMRLPDAPAPCADGRWSVPAYRKFLGKKRAVVKGSEREELQVLCLKIKAEREQYELDQARETTRAEILERLSNEFVFVHAQHVEALRRLADTIPPRLVGLSAQRIHKILRDELQAAFDEVITKIEKRTGAHLSGNGANGRTDSKVVVPFYERRANG